MSQTGVSGWRQSFKAALYCSTDCHDGQLSRGGEQMCGPVCGWKPLSKLGASWCHRQKDASTVFWLFRFFRLVYFLGTLRKKRFRIRYSGGFLNENCCISGRSDIHPSFQKALAEVSSVEKKKRKGSHCTPLSSLICFKAGGSGTNSQLQCRSSWLLNPWRSIKVNLAL